MSVEGSERQHAQTARPTCDHAGLLLLLETHVPLGEEPIEEVHFRTRRHQSHASCVFFCPSFRQPVDAYKLQAVLKKSGRENGG